MISRSQPSFLQMLGLPVALLLLLALLFWLGVLPAEMDKPDCCILCQVPTSVLLKAQGQPYANTIGEVTVNTESAVHFATASRVHMGLAARNVQQSVVFYRMLFGQEPTKTRQGYAKFEVAEPPVNLSLNEVAGETGSGHPVTHFGIQVKSTEAVNHVAARLQSAGITTRSEEQVSCCYAVQNKIWATDPDGNKWEVYVLLDDNASQRHSSQGACCPQMETVLDAAQRGDAEGVKAAYSRATGSGCGCSA